MLRAMAEAPVELIKRVPLFSDLDDRELKQIAQSMKERTFNAGDTVTEEGKGGIGFFVIADGTAKVSIGGDRGADVRAPATTSARSALIADIDRTATITAESDLRCYGMTSWDFRPLVEGERVDRLEDAPGDGAAAQGSRSARSRGARASRMVAAAGRGRPDPARLEWPERVTREWALDGATGKGVRVCILDSGVDAEPSEGRRGRAARSSISVGRGRRARSRRPTRRATSAATERRAPG